MVSESVSLSLCQSVSLSAVVRVRARKQEIDSTPVASAPLCVPLPQCLNERLGSQSYLRQNPPINFKLLVSSNPGWYGCGSDLGSSMWWLVTVVGDCGWAAADGPQRLLINTINTTTTTTTTSHSISQAGLLCPWYPGLKPRLVAKIQNRRPHKEPSVLCFFQSFVNLSVKDAFQTLGPKQRQSAQMGL